ncbi:MULTISPECIES: SDR family NAD(P)-dependent oxidoreductase [unclassified Mesorhizobium]|uniref:SDR family NAD(P)-dependent oxidoreductase n=1 Tax=unclassified Mesorhizobium TaxID=325217 RepID=UPI001CCF1813|nr:MULTISPECIES: SDR family NAD(P)-dependent oxidoreductase [unclassified Mesorhizobium]MBZ9739813.1 SDR family oxidoreductase [Mesorhizobium sp. CO1-1-4]MBZ9805624.1 SDR family oxidoreductase [Mesorhizobium sp. ES1-6]
MKRFEQKVAIVTGGGGGIGSAISHRLADEGAFVAVTDMDLASAGSVASDISAKGGKARAIRADISNAIACADLVADVLRINGRIDILANNAGINRRGNLLTLTEGDWHSCFDVNLHSMFYLCRAVLPHMIERGGGAIVNTASQWGLHPAPNHIAYNVTKAAVASFTQNLARDYAPHKIRVNAVCPGEIHTPMLEAGVKRSGRTIADLDRLVPFGRIGKPEEVAALVAFLASDEAQFMCGSLVEITGAQAVA